MLRLELLGGFRAYTESGEASALSKQPRRAALLAFLALERDTPRSRVVSVLWPEADGERARHSLNQAIYSLRRVVGADWVELRGDRCVVAPWVSTDVEELERAAAAGDDASVLALYQGPLLEGVPVGVTADFDVWLAQRRSATERMHRASRRARLAELIAAGRQQEALACAEAWCRLDPHEDEAQHRFIQLLADIGRRTDALQQFRSYARLLDEDGLTPLDETLALVAQLQHGDVGALPLAVEPLRPGAPAFDVPAPPTPARRWPALLETRRGLSALLTAVFLLNLFETTLERWLGPRLPNLDARRLELARAAHWLEGGLTFEHHELMPGVAVVGLCLAYFFVFPLLLAAVPAALARRHDIAAFRVFALAVAFVYLICLPFFLFVPLPERWWFPDSGAVLLSDVWSPLLIDVVRLISGLDNSFPSAHVALTAVAVASSFLWRLRFRWSVLFLGGAVVLSTFALGIHWLPDIAAGAATGVLGVTLALRAEARLGRPVQAGATAPREAASQRGGATPAGARA